MTKHNYLKLNKTRLFRTPFKAGPVFQLKNIYILSHLFMHHFTSDSSAAYRNKVVLEAGISQDRISFIRCTSQVATARKTAPNLDIPHSIPHVKDQESNFQQRAKFAKRSLKSCQKRVKYTPSLLCLSTRAIYLK